MPTVEHLSRDDVRRVPWKNGRGTTEELAIAPAGAAFERGDFAWRISKARIEAPGPFSCFPGYERILVVTAGDGLVLTHGDDASRARVRPFEPYLFPGDWSTRAELVRGPVRDFNVLVRRDEWSASVEVLRLGTRRARPALARGHAFLHLLAGSATARVTGEEEPFELAAGESLSVAGSDADLELDLVGRSSDCLALLVSLVEKGRPAG